MESKWGYQLKQKANADLDNIIEYLPVSEVRKKLAGNYIMYYLPDSAKKIIYFLRIVYGKRNIDEILRRINS